MTTITKKLENAINVVNEELLQRPEAAKVFGLGSMRFGRIIQEGRITPETVTLFGRTLYVRSSIISESKSYLGEKEAKVKAREVKKAEKTKKAENKKVAAAAKKTAKDKAAKKLAAKKAAAKKAKEDAAKTAKSDKDADDDGYSSMSVKQLREECKTRELPFTGSKSKLVARLTEDDTGSDDGETDEITLDDLLEGNS